MKKIIRSQLYQLVLDKAVFLVMLPWLFYYAGIVYRAADELSRNSAENMPSGGSMFANWLTWHDGANVTVFVMIISALVISKDFSDKTLNYELLSGKTRPQVFFSRFFIALIFNEILTLVQVWAFPLVYTAQHGWGINLPIEGAIYRTFIIMCLTFRLTAETAFATVVVKRKGLAYFIPIGAFYILGSIGDMICAELQMHDNTPKWSYWLTNIFSMEAQFEVIDFKSASLLDTNQKIYKYLEPYPDSGKYALLAATLGIGLIVLISAYRKFAKKDLE